MCISQIALNENYYTIKYRPLGIASIRDRIVQEALRMTLEPIFEADFSERSYGFRPNRRTMDAIDFIRQRVVSHRSTYFWIIEGDISSYFDSICHRRLLRLMRRRIKDEKLLDLIWKFLRAGVMEGKLFRDTQRGVPQGGIFSPLAANIYLHELDKYMEGYTALSASEKQRRRAAGLPNFFYTRYADDFAVLCNGTRAQAEAMRQELHSFLRAELKLELSLEKTRITHVNDGFQFLGFWIQRRIGTTGKMVPKILIPEEAQRKYLHKMRQALSASTHQDSVRTKITALNRVIRGWGHYYQYASSPKAVFARLDYQVFWLMAHWLGRKYKARMPAIMRRFYHHPTLGSAKLKLAQLGTIPTKRYVTKKIPNPYTTPTTNLLWRENLISMENLWTGNEARPGGADWRDLVLERDGSVCAACGREFPEWELELDHVKPRGRFRRTQDADYLENFQLLCTFHHRVKTEKDRLVLSHVP